MIFFGFNIRSYQTSQGFKVLTCPAKDRVKAFKLKFMALFRKYRSDDVGELISDANNLIIVTVNYWRYSAVKLTFHDVDNYVWALVRRYLIRQHLNKFLKWIRDRYFKEDYSKQSKDNYILTNPKEPRQQLVKMSWTHINYARTIKYNCNHYGL